MSGEDTDFSQELWAAFANGFPIDNLKPLLTSTDQKILGLGAYLIYELGAKARPLLDDIVPLLKNSDPQIRGSAIIAIEECATKFDTHALGKVMESLNDPDPFVQRITMRFIQSCERNVLEVGIRKAAEMNPGTIFEELPGYLSKTVFCFRRLVPVSAEILESLLTHEDPVANRFGVGLATRPRLIVDVNFVTLASQLEDKECRNLVNWAMERPCRLTYAESMKL